MIIRIFWEAFVSSSLNQHRIIFTSQHITGDIESYLDHFMILGYKDLIGFTSQAAEFHHKYQHLQQIHIFALFSE